MSLDKTELRTTIREAFEACDLQRMDHLMLLLVVVYEVDLETIEAVMREEVAKLSEEHRRYWYGAAPQKRTIRL